jgi:hypothetical protein
MPNTSQLTSNPYVFADELEARGLLNPHAARTFSCACCRLIWAHLPTIAQEALDIAEAYLQHQASDELLVATRVKLWTFLGPESCNFASPSVNAIRAIICCLYSDTSMRETNHLYDTVTTTMDFCNAVMPYREEHIQLLRDIFHISR